MKPQKYAGRINIIKIHEFKKLVCFRSLLNP